MAKPEHSAKTRRQIADEHGISVRTLNRRLRDAGIEIPHGLVYPAHQLLIHAILGSGERPGVLIPDKCPYCNAPLKPPADK